MLQKADFILNLDAKEFKQRLSTQIAADGLSQLGRAGQGLQVHGV